MAPQAATSQLTPWQTSEVVSQVWPVGQSEVLRHWTHWVAATSQTGVAGSPAQSPVVRHSTHWPAVVSQTGVAPEQLLLDVHPLITEDTQMLF
jgi:hypothetical protein